jgi:hypothetical protein
MSGLDFSMLNPRPAPARQACGIDVAGLSDDVHAAKFPLPPVADVSSTSYTPPETPLSIPYHPITPHRSSIPLSARSSSM